MFNLEVRLYCAFGFQTYQKRSIFALLGNQTRVQVSLREALETKRAFLAHFEELLETEHASKRHLNGGLVSKLTIK